MISPDVVVLAYNRHIKLRYNRFGKPISLKGKTKENAELVIEICRGLGVDVGSYMTKAMSLYDPEWCRSSFGTPWPPFNVVVGPKCRDRVTLQLKPVQVAPVASREAVKEWVVSQVRAMKKSCLNWRDMEELLVGGYLKEHPKWRFLLKVVRKYAARVGTH